MGQHEDDVVPSLVGSPTIPTATIDPRAFSIARQAAASIGRIDPKVFSISQELARSVRQAGISTQVVASIAGSLQSFSAPAMSQALKGFQTPRLVDTFVLGETLNSFRATGAFTFMKSLDEPIVTAKLAESLRPNVAQAFGAFHVPNAFSAGVNDALKDLARIPTFEVGPQFKAALREAALIAESPAVIEEVDKTLVDLGDVSPVLRRELLIDLTNAVATLGTLIAILARDDHVELASACLALAAIFVQIYWRLGGKLDE
jgi:hypothetical protein